MDRKQLLRIDEDLGSKEVAELRFLCTDIIKRKQLERVKDAKELFSILEDKGLLENTVFLADLLNTINRKDLVKLLNDFNQQPEETDACPTLSPYRVMLYHLYEDFTDENVKRMKFVVKLNRGQLERCENALDVFAEMEKSDLLSPTKLEVLHEALTHVDRQMATNVKKQMLQIQRESRPGSSVRMAMDESVSINPRSSLPPLLVSKVQHGSEPFHPDAVSPSPLDQTEYYTLNNIPRGVCFIINNEQFHDGKLKKRAGTQQDVNALKELFQDFGFTIVIHDNLTSEAIRENLNTLGAGDFCNDDALVVCVLSHGETGTVYGSDGEEVSIRDITQPFTSERAPSLAGKPKLFFFQACQGHGYQRGSLPASQGNIRAEHSLEADAGRFSFETVPAEADFLIGMPTVQDYRSFRNVNTGSIYIQELCKQLRLSAERPDHDDVLSVLTRVNREVSKGTYMSFKQMPEPKFTLTKKLVLKYVKQDSIHKRRPSS